MQPPRLLKVSRKFYAKQQANIFLVARNEGRLNIVKDDLISRGAGAVGTYSWSAESTDNQQELVDAAKAFLQKIEVIFIAYGSLPNQMGCENSVEATLAEINVNGLSVIALLTTLANEMIVQGSGTIAVVSSVAGDRGRQSNYVYGAAKALLSTFLSGLRARLYKKNINVLTIKPGFVDTPMTAHLQKSILFVSSDKVAIDIVNGIKKKKDVLYTPTFWRFIMLIIKLIPERIFKKLNF